MLGELTGSRVDPSITGEFRPGDNRHDFADITRLRREFGDCGFTDLRTAMEKLVEWSSGEEAERRKFLKL
jgi:nucleoside-diphosphate-sugar epimerase